MSLLSFFVSLSLFVPDFVVELFETSPLFHYQGNTINQKGEKVVNMNGKKATELDVGPASTIDIQWAFVSNRMTR